MCCAHPRLGWIVLSDMENQVIPVWDDKMTVTRQTMLNKMWQSLKVSMCNVHQLCTSKKQQGKVGMFHCLKVIPVWDDMHVMPKTMWKVANPIHWAKCSNVDGHDKIPIPDPSQTGMKLQYQNNKRKMSRHKGRKWIMFVMSSVCARTTSCPTVRITNPDRKKDSSQSGMTPERWKMEEAIRDSDVCWFSKKTQTTTEWLPIQWACNKCQL